MLDLRFDHSHDGCRRMFSSGRSIEVKLVIMIRIARAFFLLHQLGEIYTVDSQLDQFGDRLFCDPLRGVFPCATDSERDSWLGARDFNVSPGLTATIETSGRPISGYPTNANPSRGLADKLSDSLRTRCASTFCGRSIDRDGWPRPSCVSAPAASLPTSAPSPGKACETRVMSVNHHGSVPWASCRAT